MRKQHYVVLRDDKSGRLSVLTTEAKTEDVARVFFENKKGIKFIAFFSIAPMRIKDDVLGRAVESFLALSVFDTMRPAIEHVMTTVANIVDGAIGKKA